MKRFENAQVGDFVWCRKYGNGVIDIIGNIESLYMIGVGFEGEKEKPIVRSRAIFELYTIEGYLDIEDAEPMLFYRKGEERYLTERPEHEIDPEIDWANVKCGTMFYCGDTESPSRICAFHIFDGERPWFRSSTRKDFDRIFVWKYTHPVNPSEVPYK